MKYVIKTPSGNYLAPKGVNPKSIRITHSRRQAVVFDTEWEAEMFLSNVQWGRDRKFLNQCKIEEYKDGRSTLSV